MVWLEVSLVRFDLLEVGLKELFPLLEELAPERLEDRRYGVAELQGNSLGAVLRLVVQPLLAGQELVQEIEIVLLDSVMKWRAVELAAALVEVEERVLHVILVAFSLDLVVLQGEGNPVILAVVEGLMQAAEADLVALLNLGAVLEQEEAELLRLELVLIEIAHHEVERSVALAVHAIQVLVGLELLHLLELLQDLVRDPKVLVRERHVQRRAILDGLLCEARPRMIEQHANDGVLLVPERQDERRREVSIDRIQKVALALMHSDEAAWRRCLAARRAGLPAMPA